jgi:7-cyano-7-deazaguanine reductase
MSSTPSTSLETFDNPQQDRDYTIRIDTPEFTCLCPITGQPDFATIQLEYIADKLCLELKSLKLYFWSFRDQGAFHEAVTNQILSDLVAAISPRFMRVSADFNVRGGIYTQVIAEHRAEGWVAPAPVVLPQ